jgi:hypothetical protein
MKLQDIAQKKGTYVGLRVIEPSSSQMYDHAKKIGVDIKQSSKERRLHTTVIYSTKRCPNLVAEPKIIHEAEFVSYDLFSSSDGAKVLVVKLNAPSVVARHLALMAEHNAVYDFPTFQPHISLSYDYKGDILSLAPIDFPILLSQEYIEDLNVDWK